MKNRGGAWWGCKSLMTQGMTINGIIISVIAVIALVLAQCFIKSYEAMLSSQLTTILDISTDSVQATVDGIETASMNFMADDDLQRSFKILTDGDTVSYDGYIAAGDLKKHILDLANENRAIKFAVLLDSDYNHVVSAMGQNDPWNSDMSRAISGRITNGLRYEWITPCDELDDLVVVRQLVDMTDPEFAARGYIVLGIDIAALVTEKNTNLKNYPLKSLVMRGDEVLYSEFQDNDVSSRFMTEIIDKGTEHEISINGEKYFCTYKTLGDSEWKYAVYVPHRDVLGSLEFAINICTAVFLLTVLLIFFISYISTKSMIRPLKELSNKMKKVESGIFEGVEVTDEESKNEINALALDFNVMINKIDTLIKENYLKQILLQESELKLLQSQINPHFLYNTLESINWMAKSGRTKEISVMVQALSKLFRSAVNNKESLITIADELDLLESYIAIQKIRFEERLIVDVDIDEDFYSCRVPKLILQPLVENSIKYALEKYKTVCVILIYSEKTEHGMKLYISDNGPGIEEKRLKLIRENNPFESRSGIALKNIRRRLEIAYNKNDVMEIKSGEGQGTTIVLNIPG